MDSTGAGRRGFLAGAVAGLAGAAVVAGTGPAAAATGGLDWFDVKDFGAVGDGIADDTDKIQQALDAAKPAGGTVYFPAGTYLVKPSTVTGVALTVGGNGIRLVGAGSKAATLVKGGNGILLRMSGRPTDSSGAEHRRYCSVETLGLNGNQQTGLLLELYYADNFAFRDVFLTSNNDVCVDAVEFWDSRFYNLVVESSTSTAANPLPNVWLRNSSSATAGSWGYSVDNINQIHFVGCRFENFGTGALWITQGTLKYNNPNGIYLTDCKFETSAMQGGPHLKVDASCRGVYASHLYCFAGNFAGTFKDPQNIIAWAGAHSVLENVLISNGSVATVNSGIDLYSGAGSTAVLRNVTGTYATAPAGAHIYYESTSTGDFRVEASYGSKGAQSSGTIPTRHEPNPPLRLVAGPVDDASFTRTPADGTLAVDTVNGRLYVRVGGVWKSSALSG